MIHWTFLHPRVTMDHLGLIPFWLHEEDPDDAVEQINKNYMHGGGWRDYDGFTMEPGGMLIGKGDPPLQPLAESKLREEVIYFYQYAWVAVKQPDGSFRVARID